MLFRSAAAELCAVPTQEWLALLRQQAERARSAASLRLDGMQQHLDRLQQIMGRPQSGLNLQSKALSRLAMRASRSAVGGTADEGLRLKNLGQRMAQSVQRAVLSQRHRLDKIEALSQAMNPRLVLERGYTWLQDGQGHALSRAPQFSPGMRVLAVLADGEVGMTVDAPRQHG